MSGIDPAILDAAEAARREFGYLSLAETAALAARGVRVLDPFSTLISPAVQLGPGVVLHPGVRLRVLSGGRLRIGPGTQVCTGSSIEAEDASVEIGDAAEIGARGGFHIEARGGKAVEVGRRVRLAGGGCLSDGCRLGDGAQVLGGIDARHCRLAGGGDYTEPDPDRRGAVLKGAGQARDIALGRGEVIQAFGLFAEAPVRMQSSFHPPSRA